MKLQGSKNSVVFYRFYNRLCKIQGMAQLLRAAMCLYNSVHVGQRRQQSWGKKSKKFFPFTLVCASARICVRDRLDCPLYFIVVKCGVPIVSRKRSTYIKQPSSESTKPSSQITKQYRIAQSGKIHETVSYLWPNPMQAGFGRTLSLLYSSCRFYYRRLTFVFLERPV